MNEFPIVKDKRTQKALKKFKLDEDARKYLEEIHSEYCIKFELTDPVSKDAVLGALYFYYMTFDQTIEPELKVKYFKAYTDTLKNIGILNPKELLNRVIESMSNKTKIKGLLTEV